VIVASFTSSGPLSLRVVTLAVLVAIMSSCASSPEVRSTARQGASSTASSATESGNRASQDPYPAVPGHVALYVTVPDSRVPADGRNFNVVIVLVNGLGRSFIIPGACNGWIFAGLRSSTVFSGFPGDGGVYCAGRTIAPGHTRTTLNVSTGYDGCSADPATRPTPSMPRCTGPSGQPTVPNLPPGTYHLQLSTPDIPDAVIRGQTTVVLTKP
jgi:hypothetical protein